jgi:rhodanese-related sulfurtransferase
LYSYKAGGTESAMKAITPIELFNLMQARSDIQLIDVREQDEHEAFNIGGELMPLGTITRQIDKIERQIPVVFYCRKGVRSHIAIQRLQQKYPFENLINLTGGMDDWKKMLP